MALKQSPNKIPLPDEGVIPARLARIVEIGEHETKFGVKDQVYLFYSLPTRIIDAPESDFHGKQHMIRTRPLTMSSNDKAWLKKHIKAIHPKFDLGGDDISLEPLLNKAGYVNVQHNQDVKKQKTYANLIDIMPVPEGQTVGELDTTAWYLNWDNPDIDVWTKYVSDWQKELIKEAHNYEGSPIQEMVMRLDAMSGSSEE